MPLTPAEADFIFRNDLGCRYGATTAGAAYGFMDIVGEGRDGGDTILPPDVLIRWLTHPEDFEPRWDQRLWNTCGMIVSLSDAGRVILVTRAIPTAERYHFGAPVAQGDGYTFRKCNRLPANAQILAAIDYGDADALVRREREDLGPDRFKGDVSEKAVTALYEWIEATIRKLAKS